MKGVRFKRKLHQADVARFIGVDVRTYARWERELHQPMDPFYPRIFEFLGYIPDFMLAEDARLKATDYGKWLTYRRKLKGIGREDFAENVGVTVNAVWHWETNRRRPYPRLQQKILDVLEPLHSLPTGDELPEAAFKCSCHHRRGPRMPV